MVDLIFSTDLKSVYLSMILGVSSILSMLSENDEIKKRQNLKEIADECRRSISWKHNSNIIEVLDLAADNDDSFASYYQLANIYAYKYDVSLLPMDKGQLLNDYRTMLEVYHENGKKILGVINHVVEEIFKKSHPAKI